MEDNQVVEDFKQQYLDAHGMPLGHNPLDLRSYDLYLSDGGLLVLKYNRISMAGADYYRHKSCTSTGAFAMKSSSTLVMQYSVDWMIRSSRSLK